MFSRSGVSSSRTGALVVRRPESPISAAHARGRRRIATTLLCALLCLLFAAVTAHAEPPGSAVEYRSGLPSGGSPRGVAPGADGNLWFPDVELHAIGRVTPAGQIQELALPVGEAEATDVALGSDGEIWASLIPNGQQPGEIARIGPSGEVEAFPLPEGAATDAFSITRGPGEDVWFTLAGESESQESRFGIGRIVTAGPKKGEIEEFRTGFRADSYPSQITLGPDGNLWFIALGTGEHPAAPAIGKITPGGEVHEYTAGLPGASEPDAITTGPDGDVWFTDDGQTPAIGRVTPSGEIKEFSAGLPAEAEPAGIATGADGNLWFADNGNGRVGRITPSGAVTEFPDTLGEHFFSGKLSDGPDGRMWLTDHGLDPGVMAVATGGPAGAGEARIEGVGALGEQLTCAGASWPAMNGAPASMSAFPFDGYSWLLDGAPIAGARGARYTPTPEQGGHQIACRVTATYPTPVVTEVSESQPLKLAGGPPSASGALAISPAPVYSTASVECAGAKWSAAKVETQWLVDGAAVAGATGSTFVPSRELDGRQLSCSQTATAEGGLTRTLTSAQQPIHELAPFPSWSGEMTTFCKGALACIEPGPNPGETYAHEDTWYSATPIECASAPWTSAAGDSILEPIKALAEAHLVSVRLERITGATTITLADVQLNRLTTPRDEATYQPLARPNITVSYGLQDFAAGELSAAAAVGHPNPWVAGQGVALYYLPESDGPARSFLLRYNLTTADLGSRLRCVVEAQDGPPGYPSGGFYTTAEVKVSTDPNCAPLSIAPTSFPQPLLFDGAAGREECVPAPAPPSERKLAPEVPKLPVLGGSAAIALNCNLPGGCHGSLAMTGSGAGAAEARRTSSTRAITFARAPVHIPHGHRRALRLKLSTAAQRLLRGAGAHGLQATLVLISGGRRHVLGHLVLVKGAKR